VPKPVVVIGNGPSRRLLDPLDQIPYDTIGCNSIIEEFVPTYLMFNDAWSHKEMRTCKKKYQKPPPEHDRYEFGSCGGAAFYAACSMGYDPVYLIGFDGNEQGHASPDWGMRRIKAWKAPPTLSDRWVAGFEKVRKMFPDTEVSILGERYSMLDSLFPRVGLKPWEK
jgi:hypothetical protein